MNPPRTTRFAVAAVLAVVAVVACDSSRASDVTAPSYLATATEATSVWASQVQGVTESGALYALFLPHAWNGRLVIFIHGLVDPARPLALPALGAAADTLAAHGNALAYSSFSENGWAVKDGAQRTHELGDLFAAQFGEPTRTYLYGQSMGGLIALKLAESYPTQYAGVLAECGILGGSFERFRYMFDVRLLFDFFYPGVLPGTALAVPEPIDLLNQIRLPARAAMVANPDGAHKIAAIVQTPVPFSSDAELLSSIEDQLFRHAREVNDLIARGQGEPPVGNRDVEYTGALDPGLLQAINSSVPRASARWDSIGSSEASPPIRRRCRAHSPMSRTISSCKRWRVWRGRSKRQLDRPRPRHRDGSAPAADDAFIAHRASRFPGQAKGRSGAWPSGL